MIPWLNYSTPHIANQTENSDLKSLMNEPNTKLEDLLRFPNIASELKFLPDSKQFLNKKGIENLLKFVFDSEFLKRFSHEEGCKFSHQCMEILLSNNPIINEYFFTSANLKRKSIVEEELDLENVGKELLSPINSVKSKSTVNNETFDKLSFDVLFSFLEASNLNETQFGYLSRIANSFISKNKNEFFRYIYKSGFDFNLFISNFHSHSISDIVSNIIFGETNLNNDSILFHESKFVSNTDYSKQKTEILKSIIMNVLKERNSDKISNLKYLIEDFFNKSKVFTEFDFIFTELFSNFNLLGKLLNEITKNPSKEQNSDYLICVKAFFKYLSSTSSFQKNESSIEISKTFCSKVYNQINKSLNEEMKIFISNVFQSGKNSTVQTYSSTNNEELRPISKYFIVFQEILSLYFFNQNVFDPIGDIIDENFVKFILFELTSSKTNNIYHNILAKNFILFLNNSNYQGKMWKSVEGCLDYISKWIFSSIKDISKQERKNVCFIDQFHKVISALIKKEAIKQFLSDQNNGLDEFLKSREENLSLPFSKPVDKKDSSEIFLETEIIDELFLRDKYRSSEKDQDSIEEKPEFNEEIKIESGKFISEDQKKTDSNKILKNSDFNDFVFWKPQLESLSYSEEDLSKI